MTNADILPEVADEKKPTRVVGRRCDSTMAAIDAALTSLLADCAPEQDEVLVVPDVHYPFHPTTGLVTNPNVVETLVEALSPRTHVTLGLPPSLWVEDTTTFLGYDALADRTGVETLPLADAPTVERTARIGDQYRTVEIPEPLDTRPVVVVPTLRTTPALGAAMVTTALGAGLGDGAPDPDDVVAATAICDPVFVLLDGTYTYTGAPHRGQFLLAGTDAPAVDRAAAGIVGRSSADEPSLSPFGREQEAIEGLDTEELAAELPSERVERGDPPAVVAAGYRLYARVTGDLVPPQFVR